MLTPEEERELAELEAEEASFALAPGLTPEEEAEIAELEAEEAQMLSGGLQGSPTALQPTTPNADIGASSNAAPEAPQGGFSLGGLVEQAKSNAGDQIIGLGAGFTRFGQGMKQAALEAGELLGIVEEGSADAYTKSTVEERKLFDNTEIGQSITGKVNTFIGDALPAVVSGGLALKAGSALAKVAVAAAEGTALGATVFVDEDDSRAMNTLVGGTVGTVVGGAGAFWTRGAKKMKELIESDINDDVASRLIKEGDDITKDTGIDLSAGQVSENQVVKEFEASFVDQKSKLARRALSNRQKQQAVDRLTKLSTKAQGKVSTGAAVREAHESAANAIRDERGVNWATGMQRAKEISGDQPIINVNNLRGLIAREIDGHESAILSADSPIMAKKLRTMQKKLGDGPLTAEQVQKVLVDLTGQGKGGGAFGSKIDAKASTMFSRDAKAAILTDLEVAEPGLTKDVADAILAVRSQYRAASRELDAITDGALGDLLKRGTASPEEFYKRVMGLEGSDLANVTKILDNRNKSVMQSVRANAIKDALEKSQPFEKGAAGGVNFDATAFLREASKLDKTLLKDVPAMTSTLRALQKMAPGGVDVTRVIAGKPVPISGVHALSRIIRKYGNGQNLSRLLVRKGFREAVKRAASNKAAGASGPAARVAVMLTSGADNIDEEGL